MRSVDEPFAAPGPFLQTFCGIILGLTLLPLRKVSFEEKMA
jgi:hypothetical protein